MTTLWDDLPEYLSVEQVADALQVSTSHIHRLIRIGALPAIKLGEGLTSPYRIQKSDLLYYLSQKSVADSD